MKAEIKAGNAGDEKMPGESGLGPSDCPSACPKPTCPFSRCTTSVQTWPSAPSPSTRSAPRSWISPCPLWRRASASWWPGATAPCPPPLSWVSPVSPCLSAGSSHASYKCNLEILFSFNNFQEKKRSLSHKGRRLCCRLWGFFLPCLNNPFIMEREAGD